MNGVYTAAVSTLHITGNDPLSGLACIVCLLLAKTSQLSRRFLATCPRLISDPLSLIATWAIPSRIFLILLSVPKLLALKIIIKNQPQLQCQATGNFASAHIYNESASANRKQAAFARGGITSVISTLTVFPFAKSSLQTALSKWIWHCSSRLQRPAGLRCHDSPSSRWHQSCSCQLTQNYILLCSCTFIHKLIKQTGFPPLYKISIL